MGAETWEKSSKFSALVKEMKRPSASKLAEITAIALEDPARYYKHIVVCLEKHILHSKSTYKLSNLYIADQLLRASKRKFSSKDKIAPRMLEGNRILKLFKAILTCPTKDLDHVGKVVRRWRSDSIFPPKTMDELDAMLRGAGGGQGPMDVDKKGSGHEQGSSGGGDWGGYGGGYGGGRGGAADSYDPFADDAGAPAGGGRQHVPQLPPPPPPPGMGARGAPPPPGMVPRPGGAVPAAGQWGGPPLGPPPEAIKSMRWSQTAGAGAGVGKPPFWAAPPPPPPPPPAAYRHPPQQDYSHLPSELLPPAAGRGAAPPPPPPPRGGQPPPPPGSPPSGTRGQPPPPPGSPPGVGGGGAKVELKMDPAVLAKMQAIAQKLSRPPP